MTSRAMGGSMLFQDALKMRLDLMAISSESMTRFLAEHPARLSPGIRELVALLHSRGVQVYLVSGGFRLVIHPIADALNIPQSNVFANTLLFNVRRGSLRGRAVLVWSGVDCAKCSLFLATVTFTRRLFAPFSPRPMGPTLALTRSSSPRGPEASVKPWRPLLPGTDTRP